LSTEALSKTWFVYSFYSFPTRDLAALIVGIRRIASAEGSPVLERKASRNGPVDLVDHDLVS
jgi:hypothetical protein